MYLCNLWRQFLLHVQFTHYLSGISFSDIPNNFVALNNTHASWKEYV